MLKAGPLVMKSKGNYTVLLVDSECAICNRSVKFIRKHQRKDDKILFRSLFSDEGKKYLKKYGLPEDYNESLVLIEQGKHYLGSDAVLLVTKKMKGLFPLLSLFLVLPRRFRDYFYMLVSRHRHLAG